LLIHGAHCSVNSELGSKIKTNISIQGRGYQLLKTVDLAVRHIDVSGGMVRVRAAEQGSKEFWVLRLKKIINMRKYGT
jgi:hypothetical protein